MEKATEVGGSVWRRQQGSEGRCGEGSRGRRVGVEKATEVGGPYGVEKAACIGRRIGVAKTAEVGRPVLRGQH